ncbi:hypothetical protein BIZ37_24250 [Photobacterium sp. BZF1]|uniref:hypothetical protein n=1 Tax=Photobacterium sp. BZF1 TaxID=1904457 RepID=UPI00165392C0|nr:hypothetical protein [Photobacterium sp. BZF1]MBC7005674.1 hypothetical protein [Photobacterium sp. BZF1]
MGRITKEQKEKNYHKINSIILAVFLDEGWTSITYDRIARETGLRKSTLQGYYPTNSDFLLGIRGHLHDLMIEKLDFSSKESLITSWNNALKSKGFNYTIDMFINHVVSRSPSPMALNALTNMACLLRTHFPKEDSKELMIQLFGNAVVHPLFDNRLES